MPRQVEGATTGSQAVGAGAVLTIEDYSVDYLADQVVHAVRGVDLALGPGRAAAARAPSPTGSRGC